MAQELGQLLQRPFHGPMIACREGYALDFINAIARVAAMREAGEALASATAEHRMQSTFAAGLASPGLSRRRRVPTADKGLARFAAEYETEHVCCERICLLTFSKRGCSH